jgi:cyclic beta-1,2-glucan synthetase
MTEPTHLDTVGDDGGTLLTPEQRLEMQLAAFRAEGTEITRRIPWLPNTRSSRVFDERLAAVRQALRPVFKDFRELPKGKEISDDQRWLHDNLRLFSAGLEDVNEGLRSLRRLPHVRTESGAVEHRVIALAEGFLRAADFRFTEAALSSFVEGFQEVTVLNMKELWALPGALKLVLLEEIARRAEQIISNPAASVSMHVCVGCLRDVAQSYWKMLIEPLIVFDQILRQDPAGAYPRMDYESRELYRDLLIKIADRTDFTEVEVANKALALAEEASRQTHESARVRLRLSHIGYYICDDGKESLFERVGFRPSFGQRVELFLKKHPNEFYLPGIEVLTFAIMSAIVLLLTSTYTSPWLILFAMLVLLLPSSQSAVQLMNYLTTSLLPAQILPKRDFSDGVTNDCVTLVAVPSLLLNRDQVCRLVDDLEIRYLGNHDSNIHYALLSDLPDSPEMPREDNPLVEFCAQLIRDLNKKYASRGAGKFFMFHRHRVYNSSERVWMGWERKRGKLLDLNRLLRSQYDSFPVKVGELEILEHVRFVITLDADTELPRRSAHRMIGALAHPLNQAIIDPEKNIVVAGYGVLQPRVGVSVQSAASSRLANIYSGETGFDIYTRAISDVYQDLYGEGIFAGKGIYEVDTVHQVLDRRFPRNALLSHDLIEGAYARAGLASDIEIIEDYPSRYSAYNKRKHRWLRGDWQITNWLLSRVPDETGRLVPNPISLVSQWKILDNLRRSLVEPATFLLFVFGWLMLPGSPVYWTLATLCILFIPVWFQFFFTLIRAALEKKMMVAKEAVSGLVTANANVFFTLIFLAHQALVSLDAVIRTLVRRTVTQRRLLEWETAAEAEIGTRGKTPIDRYLNWTPALAAGTGILVWFGRPRAFAAALPILILWATSKLVVNWLNEPPHASRGIVSDEDRAFLRRTALHTWRYFAEYSTAEHNWLIPDNVQEEPPAVAARVSPTNLGLLLNARQVACEFGFVTIPEFVTLTSRTLDTVASLPKYRGHLFNWYDTKTLKSLPPEFVSSVDGGNLMASLWTLRQGCLEAIRRPLLKASLAEGIIDHLRELNEAHQVSGDRFRTHQKSLRSKDWLPSVAKFPTGDLQANGRVSKDKNATDASWHTEQARIRLAQIREMVDDYQPWLSSEFDQIRKDASLKIGFETSKLALHQLANFCDELTARIELVLKKAERSDEHVALLRALQEKLPQAKSNVIDLIARLREIADKAGQLADEMDFDFLLDPRRMLLSIGFDMTTRKRQDACYDLLASEARIALFVAIAKEDVPQDSWFLMGRSHTREEGMPVLVSWTGTMFEYLMPSLWMRTSSNSLLDRSRIAAVRLQREYGAEKSIPWGISESAYFKLDEAGNYQYHAFGLPALALREQDVDALVISPYSTFLALSVEPAEALENIRIMERDGWFGSYGFYEAADYSVSSRWPWSKRRPKLVRSWMAHHQGMSLLAMANLLFDNVVQRWFHADRRVQATELLLHEKPVSYIRRSPGLLRGTG